MTSLIVINSLILFFLIAICVLQCLIFFKQNHEINNANVKIAEILENIKKQQSAALSAKEKFACAILKKMDNITINTDNVGVEHKSEEISKNKAEMKNEPMEYQESINDILPKINCKEDINKINNYIQEMNKKVIIPYTELVFNSFPKIEKLLTAHSDMFNQILSALEKKQVVKEPLSIIDNVRQDTITKPVKKKRKRIPALTGDIKYIYADSEMRVVAPENSDKYFYEIEYSTENKKEGTFKIMNNKDIIGMCINYPNEYKYIEIEGSGNKMADMCPGKVSINWTEDGKISEIVPDQEYPLVIVTK